MAKVNNRGVLIGGIAAAAVLLAVSVSLGSLLDVELAVALVGERSAVSRLDRPHEYLAYGAFHLAIGLTIAWLYAAIRPRYGVGQVTAMRAGIAAWWLAVVVSTPFQVLAGGPDTFDRAWKILLGIGISAGVYIIAAQSGAWVYRKVSASEWGRIVSAADSPRERRGTDMASHH